MFKKDSFISYDIKIVYNKKKTFSFSLFRYQPMTVFLFKIKAEKNKAFGRSKDFVY